MDDPVQRGYTFLPAPVVDVDVGLLLRGERLTGLMDYDKTSPCPGTLRRTYAERNTVTHQPVEQSLGRSSTSEETKGNSLQRRGRHSRLSKENGSATRYAYLCRNSSQQASPWVGIFLAGLKGHGAYFAG